MCGAFFWPGGSPCWTGDCAPRRSLQPCCPAKRGGGMRGASAPPMDPPLLLLFFSPLLSSPLQTTVHAYPSPSQLWVTAKSSFDFSRCADLQRSSCGVQSARVCERCSCADASVGTVERAHPPVRPDHRDFFALPGPYKRVDRIFFWFLIEFWILNTGVCVQTTESQLFSPLSCAWSLEWCVDVCAQNCMHCRY